MADYINAVEFARIVKAGSDTFEQAPDRSPFGVAEKMATAWMHLQPLEHVVVHDREARRHLMAALRVGKDTCRRALDASIEAGDMSRVQRAEAWVNGMRVDGLWHELQDASPEEALEGAAELADINVEPLAKEHLIKRGRIQETGITAVENHLSALALKGYAHLRGERSTAQWLDAVHASIDYLGIFQEYASTIGRRSEDRDRAEGELFRIVHFGNLAVRAYLRRQGMVRYALPREQPFHLVNYRSGEEPQLLQCKIKPPKVVRRSVPEIISLHAPSALLPVRENSLSVRKAMKHAIDPWHPVGKVQQELKRLDELLGAY